MILGLYKICTHVYSSINMSQCRSVADEPDADLSEHGQRAHRAITGD